MKISLNIIRDTTRHTCTKGVSVPSGPRIARPVERLASLQVSLSDPRTRSNIDSNDSGTSQNANRRSNFLYPMEKSSTFCLLRKKDFKHIWWGEWGCIISIKKNSKSILQQQNFLVCSTCFVVKVCDVLTVLENYVGMYICIGVCMYIRTNKRTHFIYVRRLRTHIYCMGVLACAIFFLPIV